VSEMNWKTKIDSSDVLPADWSRGCLVGRVWRPEVTGPSVVVVREGGVFDITESFPTVRDLCEEKRPSASVAAVRGERVSTLQGLLENVEPRDPQKPWLLAPIDLQAIKGAGVTFVAGLLERFLAGQARPAPNGSSTIRNELLSWIGGSLHELKPASAQALLFKKHLIEKGFWSQYLEVGLGPDAFLFTKSQPLSAVGHGHSAGFDRTSSWNNPEPEVVLIISSTGQIQGATLGNDVHLRDVEARSALLLSKAKDNNASCLVGPFVRLFDETFSLDDVLQMDVHLTIKGEDGFELHAVSSLSQISRDPRELVAQTLGAHHQYPDGVVLFLGTAFAPVQDRDVPGKGFTHKVGDVVKIQSQQLGALTNRMNYADECEPWTFGAGQLMRNLARRGLI
jgi:fumarylacetoacetate (FAA) hydrolase family protein